VSAYAEAATAASQDSTIAYTLPSHDFCLVVLSTLLFYALRGPVILAIVLLFRASTTRFPLGISFPAAFSMATGIVPAHTSEKKGKKN
jgi:fucose permease